MIRFLFILFLLVALNADAATYYVKTTGSDSNNCTAAQTESTPKLTILSALDCLNDAVGDGAGHTVLVFAGTYTDEINENSAVIPSGTSWSAPFTLKANTVGDVIIRAVGGTGSLAVRLTHGVSKYAIIQDFVYNCDSIADRESCIGVNGASYVRFSGIEMKNVKSNGFSVSLASNHIEWIGGSIHDGLFDFTGGLGGNFGYAMYLSGSDLLVERAKFYNMPSYAIHNYNGSPNRNQFRYNEIYNFGQSTTSSCGILLGTGADNIATRNIVRNGGSTGICSDNGSTRSLIYNNTIVGNLVGISLAANTTGAIAKNNVMSANTTNFSDASSGAIKTTNFCTTSGGTTNCSASGASAGFVSSTDFNLAVGSSLINAGTVTIGALPSPLTGNVTVAYNGSLPDIGAFETWAISNCNVGDVASNKLRCNVENNVNPPALTPSSTGWTVLEAAGSKAFTGPSVIGGGSVLEFTVTVAYGSGTSCDLQYATTGTASDSALIGNALNQRLNAISSVTCTNTVSAPGTAVLTQTHARVRGLYGAEVALGADWKAAVDTASTIIPGGAARIRVKGKATTANPAAFNPTLQYDFNSSGSWATWTDTCSASVQVCAVGTSLSLGALNTEATTEQLTSDLATNVACAVVLTSSAVPLIDPSTDSEWECEYAIKLHSSIAVGTVIRFRMIKDGATAFDTYTVYPTLTVVNPGFQQL